MRNKPLVAGLIAASFVLTLVVVGAPAGAGTSSIGDAGITFSPGTATDPQRDVGEPEIHVDMAGNIWTCGPSGFSNIADYAQISTDGGDQFHLLGQPPRGQISMGEGGGDCGLATAPKKNANGKYTFAYTGLGPLANFGTGTSDDQGRTFVTSAISESPPGVDRQWNVFTDEKTVFLNYNQLALGYTVQKSTDGGLTYGPPILAGGGDGRIGPLRAILSPDGDASKAIVYFPSYDGDDNITLFRSMDGGTTWDNCIVVDPGVDPSAGFIIADHDASGNIYIAYAAKGNASGRDTYMAVAKREKIASCRDGAVIGDGKKHRVNRDTVETTVMPWLVAGDTGRVAVAFFGTDSVGNPDSGAFVASWYPYVSMSLDALSSSPTWAQAKTTSHPFHYGSICLGGLGCDIPLPDEDNPAAVPKKGDRSLADYFAMDLDPVTGRLHVVYGSSAKQPTDEIGHVSTATVVTQETGPSLLAHKKLVARRPALRQTTHDPKGDALAPYSQLFVTPQPVNHDALDVRSVEVGPELDLPGSTPIANSGMTITIKLADLSDAALQSALDGTSSQSLVYLFRFLNGFQPAGASAAWSPSGGWTFGFDDFTTRSTESGQADPTAEKIIVWNQKTSIPGKVEGNTIKLSVPRRLLRDQVGATGKGQVPSAREVTGGSTLYDGMVFTMGNSFSPTQAVQSYLYPVDSTASMDFRVGVTAQSPPATNGRNTEVLGTKRTSPLPSTGVADDAPLALALLVLAAAAAVTARRFAAR